MIKIPESKDNIPMPKIKSCIVFGVDEWPEQKESLKELGNFLELSSINYRDLGKSEEYTLIRSDGKRGQLLVKGNSVDGGYMHVEVFE